MDYKKLNDNELVYMVRENDEDSINILVKKYSPMIFKLTNEHYGRYNGYSYEFDDFYQEALNAFYKAIRTYDNEHSVLYTYVNVCMKRALFSFERTICRKEKPIVDISDLEYCIEDVRENPKNRDLYKKLENIVRDVIFGLSLEAGAILELKINGFTYKEISKLLDIPMSSVEFKSRRARNLLRNKVRAFYCK